MLTFRPLCLTPCYVVDHFSFFFFFNATATTEIYTLSLHDAFRSCVRHAQHRQRCGDELGLRSHRPREQRRVHGDGASATRSEEHTSELQSPYDLVCRLLLEKKKKRHIRKKKHK